MKLPSYVLECLNALEAAGYPAYVVGGLRAGRLPRLTAPRL